MNDDDLSQILALRLLIARAAASDSLFWWDDESLTEAGLAMASRLFARQPALAVMRLSQRAASARHRAALGHLPGAVHLFHLGDEVELLLDDAFEAYDEDLPPAMPTREALHDALVQWEAGEAPLIRQRADAMIELQSAGEGTALAQARTLAAGYLYGDRARVVFPYLRPDGRGA
ncbi:MAG: BrxE family protein [Thermomicrobiales bacterium]